MRSSGRRLAAWLLAPAALLGMLACGGAAALDAAGRDKATKALAAAQAGQYDWAAAILRGTDEPLLRVYLDWLRLRDGSTKPSFAELRHLPEGACRLAGFGPAAGPCRGCDRQQRLERRPPRLLRRPCPAHPSGPASPGRGAAGRRPRQGGGDAPAPELGRGRLPQIRGRLRPRPLRQPADARRPHGPARPAALGRRDRWRPAHVPAWSMPTGGRWLRHASCCGPPGPASIRRSPRCPRRIVPIPASPMSVCVGGASRAWTARRGRSCSIRRPS